MRGKSPAGQEIKIQGGQAADLCTPEVQRSTEVRLFLF
jgi:hypothetical protein